MAAALSIARCTLLGFGLFSCFLNLNANEYVPVLLWESSSNVDRSHSPSALSKMSSNDFQDLLSTKLQHKDIVVVFVEENLSIEDFSWQDAKRRTSFPGLQETVSKSASLTYLPRVRSPIPGVRSLGKKWQHIPFTAHDWDDETSHAKESILIINLNDGKENEDRHHFLERHDKFITRVYRELVKKYARVAAIYTAQHPSWMEEDSLPRTKREIDFQGPLNSSTWYNAEDVIYLFTPKLPILTTKNESVSLGVPTSVTKSNSSDMYALKLIVTYAEHKLTFNFTEMPAAYWVLDAVFLESPALTTPVKLLSNFTKIQAPKGFSYHCSQNVTFSSPARVDQPPEYILYLQGIQVQLFFEPLKEGETFQRFNDAYDCTSFMTIGILSGYFVIFIFAIIMAIGIMMIMDIKTMDRFDDPKGPTINFNPSE